MSKQNIKRLYSVINNSVFTINGKLDYNRVTDAVIALCNEVMETETDEFIWGDIGEGGEASLGDFIVGAYWHYDERHDGQSSKVYAALSALERIYWPNMETGPEQDTGEHVTYELLNLLAESNEITI